MPNGGGGDRAPAGMSNWHYLLLKVNTLCYRYAKRGQVVKSEVRDTMWTIEQDTHIDQTDELLDEAIENCLTIGGFTTEDGETWALPPDLEKRFAEWHRDYSFKGASPYHTALVWNDAIDDSGIAQNNYGKVLAEHAGDH